MKWNNKGHQFDELAKKICKPNETYAIWGAGTFGIAFYELFCKEINITCFIDSSTQKQESTVCGVKVFSPDYLKSNRMNVLIATGWIGQVEDYLSKLNYTVDEYIHIDDFTSIYMMYKYNKLHISDITYSITDYCTLKCKDCSAFVPYYKNKQHFELDEIKHTINKFFECVDFVNVFAIVGGDSMLHPRFEEIIDFLYEYKKNVKIGNIEVYSNAVIIPDEDTIKKMKDTNVIYRFTDYSPYTTSKQKIEKIVKILKKNGIRFDHAKFEKWSDTGYPQESNGIVEESDLIKFFDLCNRKSCHALNTKGVIYCGMAYDADRIDYCNTDESDYFSLNDCNSDNKKDLMEYMLGYSQKGYLNYCRKCNGGPNINHKYIDAGVQL